MEVHDDLHAHLQVKPLSKSNVCPRSNGKHDLARLDSSSKESESFVTPLPADSQLSDPQQYYSTHWKLPQHQQCVNSWDAAVLHKSSSQTAAHSAQHPTSQRRPASLSLGLSSGQGYAGAAATQSAASYGTQYPAAAALASYDPGVLDGPAQPSASDYSGSFSLQSGMMSPAAFVHNAQQMLLQQQQQMQQLQQQQQLQVSFQQQQRRSLPQKQQQHKEQPQRSHSSVAAAATAIASLAAAGCTRQQQQQAEGDSATSTMRAMLGDKTFYSIRSLLLKQQESFVQQMFELHRVVRVQNMACSEVADPLHKLTEQYSNRALARMQTSLLQNHRSSTKPSTSVSTPAAADQLASSCLRQHRCMPAGARPVDTDDCGAAAAADLPVHAQLLLNLPRTMRAAVAAATAGSDCTRSDVAAAKCYVQRESGLLRPVAAVGPVRLPLEKGFTGASAAAAAAAAKEEANGSGQYDEQQQQMPPPRRMIPEQAAQHQQRQQHQQSRQAAAAARTTNTSTARQSSSAATSTGLNLFRPAPQIDLSVATRFLAGGDQQSTTSGHYSFDPHSYWMKKHYGGASATAGNEQQQSSGVGSRSCQGAVSTLQKQQQQHPVSAAAAMPSGKECESAAAAAAPPTVLQWWQDPAATFGEVGLMDTADGGGGAAAGAVQCDVHNGVRSSPTTGKRSSSQYRLEHLPHKKRAKLADNTAAAAAAAGYGDDQQQLYSSSSYGWNSGAALAQQVLSSAAAAGGVAGVQEHIDGGVYQSIDDRNVSKERSRVRSNRLGSLRHTQSHCCDNSTSIIDNPGHSAAAAAAAAEVDGISLLLQVGQHALLNQPNGDGGVALVHPVAKRARGSAGSNAAGGVGSSSSSSRSQLGARSAAALLLSLSGSLG